MHTHRTIVSLGRARRRPVPARGGVRIVPRPTRSRHAGRRNRTRSAAAPSCSRRSTSARVRRSALDGGALPSGGHLFSGRPFLASFVRDEALDDRAASAPGSTACKRFDLRGRRRRLADSSAAPVERDEDARCCGSDRLRDRIKAVDFATAARGLRGAPGHAGRVHRTATRVRGFTSGKLLRLGRVSNWRDEARQRRPTTRAHDPGVVRYASAGGAGCPQAAASFNSAARQPRCPGGRVALELLFRLAPACLAGATTTPDDDRIGSPRWDRGQRDRHRHTPGPTIFTLLSFARFGTDVPHGLGLSFIWSPAPPQGKCINIYSGHLDGVNLRVTLDADGTPLCCGSFRDCGSSTRRTRQPRPPVHAGRGLRGRPLILPRRCERTSTGAGTGKRPPLRPPIFPGRSGPAPGRRFSLRALRPRLRGLPDPEAAGGMFASGRPRPRQPAPWSASSCGRSSSTRPGACAVGPPRHRLRRRTAFSTTPSRSTTCWCGRNGDLQQQDLRFPARFPQRRVEIERHMNMAMPPGRSRGHSDSGRIRWGWIPSPSGSVRSSASRIPWSLGPVERHPIQRSAAAALGQQAHEGRRWRRG